MAAHPPVAAGHRGSVAKTGVDAAPPWAWPAPEAAGRTASVRGEGWGMRPVAARGRASGPTGRESVVLLDLDETLIRERGSTEAAMAATVADAVAQRGLDARALQQAVLSAAQTLWRLGPHADYCRRIGIASWEGLWASFAEGDDAETLGLRGFAPGYRRQAWRRGLAACGCDDRDLAAELSERFVYERALRQVPFPEVLSVLVALRAAGRRLVLLTNGDRDLQRRKAVASGLLPLFDHVVISGELGVGKPEAGIFLHALGLVAARPEEAVMVGDSVARDVRGALAVGMPAVWVDRPGTWSALDGAEGAACPPGVARVPDLRGLLSLLP